MIKDTGWFIMRFEADIFSYTRLASGVRKVALAAQTATIETYAPLPIGRTSSSATSVLMAQGCSQVTTTNFTVVCTVLVILVWRKC